MTIPSIYDRLITTGRRLEGRKFTPSKFATKIRNTLNVVVDDVLVITHRDDIVDVDQVTVSGAYDAIDDQDNLRSINLYLSFNPEQKIVNVSKLDWNRFSIDVAECYGHEKVHQVQYRGRNFTSINSPDRAVVTEKDYLKNVDEIEAYGYSIAAEIFLLKPAGNLAKNIRKTGIYKTYVGVFGVLDPVVFQLLYYASMYYERFKGDDNVKNK